MRTSDIFRIADVFADLRDGAGEPWLLAGPVYDDLYNATEGTPSIVNRRVGVREMAVYGQWFNHVFFQRYGYTIPGYGVIGEHSPLGASEFTHHDFVVSGPDGATWQVIQRQRSAWEPVTRFQLVDVNN